MAQKKTKKKQTKQKMKKLYTAKNKFIFQQTWNTFQEYFQASLMGRSYSADAEQFELLHELLQPTSFLMNKVTTVVAMATNKSWSLGCLCASLCCHGDGYKDSHKRST